jgi:SAM-dependent methyltransferase
MDDLPDHVKKNRLAWDAQAPQYVDPGREAWASAEVYWGIWQVPESALQVLPSVAGLDCVELGCGTAYFSAWLQRRGGRPVGIDNSPRQLETARALQAEHGLEFPLLLGNAEAVPYPDASFDFALSEYGASIWADPCKWIPEAARLLRPGGELVFLRTHPLWMLFAPDDAAEMPVGTTLIRSYFGMHRFDWPGDEGVEFNLPHGELLRLLLRSGFEVTDLVEVQPAPDATSRWPLATVEWARRWPVEEIWRARRR